MKIETVQKDGVTIAAVFSDQTILVDPQSALELAMTVRYETGTANFVINKQAINDDFFILSTGLAGEILQKFINYHVKAAIYGDYSHYTSKPLHDFIYESNQGNHFFFTATKEEAIQKLIHAATGSHV